MKETPEWRLIRETMEPGRLTRDGMLGDDKRQIDEIIAEDTATVKRLGLTHGEIAARLRELTETAREQLGDAVEVEDKFEIRCEETRGAIPCPFRHPGRFLKNVTYLRDLNSGKTYQWTSLGVHMIERHGFYEGRGSTFRLEPDEIARVLRIKAE